MSKPYDATTKGMIERGPADWLALVDVTGFRVDLVDADVSTFSGASDKVLRIRSDPDWLMDVNVQAGPDATAPRRAFVYNALLDHRHELPVRSVIVLLSPKANLAAINGRYRRAVPGKPEHIDFFYDVVRVWELSIERLLAGGFGTLPLAPISAVKEADLPGVIVQMRERLTAPDAPPDAADLWTATEVLMGLRYSPDVIHQLFKGVHGMEESVIYQEIVEKGRVAGALAEARSTLLLLGEDRFGAPPADVRNAIETMPDLGRLRQLLRRVLHVDSWQKLLT